MRKRGLIAIIVIVALIIIDQAVKIWVKTHFYLGEDRVITSWFHLYFIENKGMAFGMVIGNGVFMARMLTWLIAIAAMSLTVWLIDHNKTLLKAMLLRWTATRKRALGRQRFYASRPLTLLQRACRPRREKDKAPGGEYDPTEPYILMGVLALVLIFYFIVDGVLGHSIDNIFAGWQVTSQQYAAVSKVVLTSFRIIVVPLLLVYLIKICRIPQTPMRYIVVLSLVIAGAAGNIFDCVFYGEIFNNPYPPQVAQMFPAGGGYAPWFMGYVVDMLYFPLISFVWPQWVPIFGGETFSFFDPVFNIADAAISCGIFGLLFCLRYLVRPSEMAARVDGGRRAEALERRREMLKKRIVKK